MSYLTEYAIIKLKSYDEIEEYYKTHKKSLNKYGLNKLMVDACFCGNLEVIKFIKSIGGVFKKKRLDDSRLRMLAGAGRLEILYYLMYNTKWVLNRLLTTGFINKIFNRNCNPSDFVFAELLYEKYKKDIDINWFDPQLAGSYFLHIENNDILKKYTSLFYCHSDFKEGEKYDFANNDPICCLYAGKYSKLYGALTPLVWGVEFNNIEMCKWLYSNGADIHINGDFPFKLAIIYEYTTIVRWMLELCPEFKKYLTPNVLPYKLTTKRTIDDELFEKVKKTAIAASRVLSQYL